jgi:hypothetical protein
MRLKRWSIARHSNRAVRTRLNLLAIERGMLLAEVPKVLEIDEAMLAFVRRHEVSLDWLFRGCLKGLSAMTYDAKHPGSYAAYCDPD